MSRNVARVASDAISSVRREWTNTRQPLADRRVCKDSALGIRTGMATRPRQTSAGASAISPESVARGRSDVAWVAMGCVTQRIMTLCVL